MEDEEQEKNLGGRPSHDLDQLAEELLYWSTQPTSLNLIGFSRPRCISVTRLPAWAKQHKRFGEAFALAKESIAVNRFEAACANEMPYIFFSRSEGMYDPLHHKYVRDEKKYESDLKKEIEGVKQTHFTIVADAGLTSKADLSASKISNTTD